MSDGAKIIRCSSLDALFDCTPSVLDEGGVRISTSGQPAELGKVVHALACDYIERGTFDLAGECQRRGIGETEQAAELMQYLVKAWDELSPYFKTPQTERVVKSDVLATRTGEYRIEGTVDVVSPAGNGAIFIDWKTGWIDDGYANQMYGYAYCIWCILGRPEEVEIVGVVAFLSHRYYRIVRYDAAKLRAWEYDLIHNRLGRPDTYHPGRQCKGCSIFASCKARQQIVSGTMQALMLPADLPDADPHKRFMQAAERILSGLTTDNKGEPEVKQTFTELRFRLALAQQVIDDTKALVRQTVERVGPIGLDGGTELVLRDTETRTLDPLKALRPLRQHLSDQDIADCMKLSLPKLLAKKAGKYMRGEKKAAREQLEKDLEAAGAVTVTVIQRLEEVDLSTEGKALPHTESNDAIGSTGVRDGGPGARAELGGSAGGGEREAVRGGGGAGGVDGEY